MNQILSAAVWLFVASNALGGMKTWDGRHDIQKIDVSVVYFLPADRRPLPDWQERVEYFCRRIELFHVREFQGQSTLTTAVHPQPLVSQLTTAELRQGDANAIFFRTLNECERRLKFAAGPRAAFPVLLVLSDVNWRPLDDFYRLRPHAGQLVAEGNYSRGEHFPGAASGGARASYLAERGVGWALVSADGWRVPYRGSDCVIYHEGCGHTIGLPHPEPGNASVMSQGQYRGWISESWIDKEQKLRLGWQPQELAPDRRVELFSRFGALARPSVPRPGQQVDLELDWPSGAEVRVLRVRFQTALDGPWIDAPQSWQGPAPKRASLGAFERETPVSYRVDAELQDGAKAELWGYFQVRKDPQADGPQPLSLSPDLIVPPADASAPAALTGPLAEETNLLGLADPKVCWKVGDWSREGEKLVSPKQYGARLELPYSPPAEYRLLLIVEPLDPPNGLIVGQRSGERRFVTLFHFARGKEGLSAIENLDDRNVGNPTTFAGNLFRKNRLSQVLVTVRKDGVTMSVDGQTIVKWKGAAERLSLSDYWKTPDPTTLFVGAYDCRYRLHRMALEPLSGTGRIREGKAPQ